MAGPFVPKQSPWISPDLGKAEPGVPHPHMRKRSERVALSRPGLEHIGPRSGPHGPSGGRGTTHANQDRRRRHVPGDRRDRLPTARKQADGWREVSYWPRFFDRNRAITALTITDLLDSG